MALAVVLLVLAVCMVISFFVVYVDVDAIGFGAPAWPWTEQGLYQVALWVTWAGRLAAPIAAVAAAVWLLVAPRRWTADVAGAAVAVGVLGATSGAVGQLGEGATFDPAVLVLFLVIVGLLGLTVVGLGVGVIVGSGGPAIPTVWRYLALALSVAGSLVTVWLNLIGDQISWGYVAGGFLEIAVLVLVTVIATGAGQFGFLLVQLHLVLFHVSLALQITALEFDDPRGSQLQIGSIASAVLLATAFMVALVGRLQASRGPVRPPVQVTASPLR